MKRFSNTSLKRFQTRFLAPVAVLAGGLLLVSNASASVINTLLTGSTGNVTVSLNSLVFNTDPEPGGACTTTLGKGCNSDVAAGTSLAFTGGPLATGEGIYINNNDLTLTAPSASDANQFLTFAAHPSLVFSETSVGPGSATTNCATANANGLSCSVFAGSPIILTYANGNSFVGIGVAGKASDTGVAGLAAGSTYTGGFSEFFTTNILVGGVLVAPTPQNIQLFFCPSGTCVAADFLSGRSIMSSQSGTFTAIAPSSVPEPSSIFLGSLGLVMLLLGARFRKSHQNRA
jgi:hypothetical protein